TSRFIPSILCALSSLPALLRKCEVCMRFEKCSFGSIRIDGVTYEHDVVIDGGGRQAKEEAIQTVSRRLWAHPLVHGRRYSLEMSSPGDRHWCRSVAGDGGRQNVRRSAAIS